MSVISALVSQKRQQELEAFERAKEACVRDLAECTRRVFELFGWNNNLFWDKFPKRLEATFHTYFSLYGIPEESRSGVVLAYANSVFGDPVKLTAHQLRLRQHSTLYCNPLSIPISIEPIGLVDEDGVVIKFVSPGGLIGIPFGYSVGGPRSVVATTAPQLQQVKKVDRDDNLLDSTPLTYGEWISYYPCCLTECCRYPMQWSDKLQTLVCPQCKSSTEFLRYA
jgi:hypothetical protein